MYESYLSKLHELIQTILNDRGLQVQSVTGRIKTIDSALSKAGRPGQSISAVSDLHDFAGVRVITYFADQVDEVAALLREHFDVDETRTKDRRDTIDPDRFGYLSMHLAIRLNGQRRSLVEWHQFEAIWTEVQIRSSLQHSWAEIEHDLGYKSSSGSIPEQYRRRFSRIAGLLELVDDEFIALREGLTEYGVQVRVDLEKGNDAVLNQASVHAFIASSELLHSIDEQISLTLDLPYITNVDKGYSASRAEELVELGYSSIREVEQRLRDRGEVISRLAAAWINTSERAYGGYESHSPDEVDDQGRWIAPLSEGISLFYLYLDQLAERGTEGLAGSHIGEFGLSTASEFFIDLRARIEKDLASAKSNLSRSD